MKTLIIYKSQTGFTKKYAQWISEETGADTITFKEAKKKKEYFFANYDSIVYGGWIMGGNVASLDWFLEMTGKIGTKKTAIYAVGATPVEAIKLEEVFGVLSEEQKKEIGTFYCPGGLDYDKMGFFCKMMMKAFASSMNKKEDLPEKDKAMAKMLLTSYDISDKRYVEDIVAYLMK